MSVRWHCLWLCVLHFLLIASVNSFSDDLYLMEELGRVLNSKFQAHLDKPLTDDWKAKIDHLFDEAPFLQDHHDPVHNGTAHKRQRRSAEEVKEEQLTLDGVMVHGSIPVDFARDICMFQVEDLEYAAVIHSTNLSDPRNSTRLSIYRMTGEMEFIKVFNRSIPYLVAMDCISFGSLGVVATAVNICEKNRNLNSNAPVFSVKKRGQVAVLHNNLIFHQKTVKLWKYGNDLFLMYAFENDANFKALPAEYECPIFKFSPTMLFELWNELPCSNALRIESFIIRSDMFVAVANSRDRWNKTETNTVVYKYDLNNQNFVSFQNILVNRVVDMRQFMFKISGEVANFLIITSSSLIDSNEIREIQKPGYSVIIIYKYVDEVFLPMQNIFIQKPTQVLPHIWNNQEMILLIASEGAAVQFYHYIGWKFEDTGFSDTLPDFESGVSSLRNYVDAKGDSIILLANYELFGSSSNLFKAHFRISEDPDLYEGILEWCEGSLSELRAVNYEDVLSQLRAIEKEQEGVLKELSINQKLILDGENITVGMITARNIEAPELGMTEENLAKLKTVRETIKTMEEMLIILEDKVQRSFPRENPLLASVNRDQSVAQGRASSSDNFLTELDVEEIETKNVNGVPIDLLATTEDLQLFFDSLTADRVIVRKSLRLEKYDSLLREALKSTGDQVITFPLAAHEVTVDSLTVHRSINNDEAIAVTKVLEEVTQTRKQQVDHIQVNHLTGKVNGIDLKQLDEIVLKKNSGDQTIFGRFIVEDLVVENDVVVLGLVNGRNVSDLVEISAQEPELAINQEVRFEGQAHFNDLHVRERIGGVKVKKNGGFDVLLKNFKTVQVLKGEALFDEVRLMEPITLHGKIPDSPLNRMNPHVVVQGDVTLEGDYEISGPVNVSRRLFVSDLLTSDELHSLGELRDYGIRSDARSIEGDILFTQPVKVHNLTVDYIGNIRVNSLLRAGLPPGNIQTVTGKKIFSSPMVSINGHVDAPVINGISVEEFAKNILLKTGNQTIAGNIHFNQIDAFSIKSDYVSHGGRDVRSLYGKDKSIWVPGSGHFRGILQAKKKLQIGVLFPKQPVFGYNITEIVHDTVFNYETNVKVIGKKIFSDKLEVRNLQTGGQYGKLANVPRNGFLKVNKEGELIAKEIRCRNLFIHKDLNGIPATEFGHLWLTVEGDQIFSAPQTFHNFRADKVTLYGSLEENSINYDVNNAMKNTYLTNRKEVVLPRATFDYEMIIDKNLIISGKINELRIPENLILKNTSLIDSLDVVGGDVHVQGRLILNGFLNEVPLEPLFDFTLNESPFLRGNLTINGSAEFLLDPYVIHLGSVDIDALYERAWMLYHAIDIRGDVNFEELQLNADATAAVVNDKDLPHFVANRFSLSQPQRVSDRMHFINEIVTHEALKTDKITTGQFLESNKLNSSIDFEFFAGNTIKKHFAEAQEVTGEWHFKDLTIQGDLEGVLINDINVAQDVVIKSGAMNRITGARSFDDLHVKNLVCGNYCYLQSVNINAWMAKLVYLHSNHWIQGTTILDSPEVQSNIRVFGLVNGIPFNPENILLKTGNQYLNVDLHVNNRVGHEIFHLSADGIDTDFVNGEKIWEDHTDDTVLVTHRSNDPHMIHGPLHFHEKVIVDNLVFKGGNLFEAQMKDIQLDMGMRKLVEEQTGAFRDLMRTVTKATQQNKEVVHVGRYVKHFNVIQRIAGGYLTYLEPIRSNSQLRQEEGRSPSTLNNLLANISEALDYQQEHYLMKVDANETGKLSLLKFDATQNNFATLNSVSDFTSEIVALRTLTASPLPAVIAPLLRQVRRQIIFLQTRNSADRTFRNHLLDFDGHLNKFRILYEFPSYESINVALIATDRGDMAAHYSPYLPTVDLFEVKWIADGILALERHGEIAKKGVKQMEALAKNHLVLLVEATQVEIWRFDAAADKFKLHFVLPAVDPLAMTTIEFHERRHLAVLCRGNRIEIFALIANHVMPYQTLVLPAIDEPLQLRFAGMTTGELLLFVTTLNPQRPLIVYRYAGVSKFVERLSFSKLVAGNGGRVGRISDLVIAGREPRNFMIMVADREAVILEAITEH